MCSINDCLNFSNASFLNLLIDEIGIYKSSISIFIDLIKYGYSFVLFNCSIILSIVVGVFKAISGISPKAITLWFLNDNSKDIL